MRETDESQTWPQRGPVILLFKNFMSGAAVSDLNEVEGRDADPIVSEGGAKSLMDIGKGLTKAMEDKNRLISYDKDRYSKNLHK